MVSVTVCLGASRPTTRTGASEKPSGNGMAAARAATRSAGTLKWRWVTGVSRPPTVV